MTYLNVCADMKNFSSPAANKCKNLHSLNFRMRFFGLSKIIDRSHKSICEKCQNFDNSVLCITLRTIGFEGGQCICSIFGPHAVLEVTS